jgi:hypothetical protein
MARFQASRRVSDAVRVVGFGRHLYTGERRSWGEVAPQLVLELGRASDDSHDVGRVYIELRISTATARQLAAALTELADQADAAELTSDDAPGVR